MKKKSQDRRNELSYFESALLSFLEQYHPELLADKIFIALRVKAAEDTYDKYLQNGSNVYACVDEAYRELLSGLEFSLFSIITDLINDNFEEFPVPVRRELSLAVMPSCMEIIESKAATYDQLSGEEKRLVEYELLGLITIYSEENGLLQ